MAQRENALKLASDVRTQAGLGLRNKSVRGCESSSHCANVDCCIYAETSNGMALLSRMLRTLLPPSTSHRSPATRDRHGCSSVFGEKSALARLGELSLADGAKRATACVSPIRAAPRPSSNLRMKSMGRRTRRRRVAVHAVSRTHGVPIAVVRRRINGVTV
jgi:hypothetical protein